MDSRLPSIAAEAITSDDQGSNILIKKSYHFQFFMHCVGKKSFEALERHIKDNKVMKFLIF